ncbi:hypothetical protein CC86DRAFT_256339, partial [Ophiobolus disseminans]
STPTIKLITDANKISSFNRGPITSVFAPPASCTATLSFTSSGSGGALFFIHYGTLFDRACYPTGTPSAFPLASDGAWNAYYYSPAICPSGWTATTTFRSSVPVHPDTEAFSLGSASTLALCCPSGYGYWGLGHLCSSSISANQAVQLFSYSFDGQSWGKGTPAAYSWLTGTTVYGDGVPIMWQASDSAVLALAAAATPTPTARASSTGTEVVSATAPILGVPPSSSSPTATGSSDSAGLSTGAKVGLGVGIPVAITAALVLAFVLWKRRRGR